MQFIFTYQEKRTIILCIKENMTYEVYNTMPDRFDYSINSKSLNEIIKPVKMPYVDDNQRGTQ